MKEHDNFKTLLGKLCPRETVDCPEILLKHGNCILASLHHLSFSEQACSMVSADIGPAHAFFARRDCRTYEQVKGCTGLTLFPRLAGEKFLVHLAKKPQFWQALTSNLKNCQKQPKTSKNKNARATTP